MLEKLATHEVESITTLFSLADKCDRAAHGTQPPKTEPTKQEAPVPPPRAVARRTRRTAIVLGCRLDPQSLQQRYQLLRQRLGARMRMANARARKVAAVVHALCIPLHATALLTVARSRNSRSGSVGGVSSPPRTAHPLLASGLGGESL